MLIIWQCCNIRKISASQLRNRHKTQWGRFSFALVSIFMLGTVPFVQSRTLIHCNEWNQTVRLLLVQNPIISKNRFYSPSNFFGQEGAVDATVLCVLWKKLRNSFFQNFSCYLTIINCKGQQIPKPLIWWGKEETPSESNGTNSGLNCSLKMSGSLCVQEESLLKHSWYL